MSSLQVSTTKINRLAASGDPYRSEFIHFPPFSIHFLDSAKIEVLGGRGVAARMLCEGVVIWVEKHGNVLRVRLVDAE